MEPQHTHVTLVMKSLLICRFISEFLLHRSQRLKSDHLALWQHHKVTLGLPCYLSCRWKFPPMKTVECSDSITNWRKKHSREMCFRFREGLPDEASYLKQPIRSPQDSSRDPKINLYRCRNFLPWVSLIPRKCDLIKHTVLTRESKFFRISWSRSKSWQFNSLYFQSVFPSRLSNWSQVFIVYNLIDHRNDVNHVQNKSEITLPRLVVSLQNYGDRAFFISWLTFGF